MSRYRKNSHLLRDRDAETQNRLLGHDVFTLERESPSPFADSPSPTHQAAAHAHPLSPLSVANANPFLDAADSDDEPDYTVAPIPMTNFISESPRRRSADYGASSSTMTSSTSHYAHGQTNTSQPTQTQPRRPNTTIKEPAKPKRPTKHQPSSNMNYPLPAISTSYTYSSGSSLETTASPSSSSSASSKSASTASTANTTSSATTAATSDSLTSVVKRRPSPFPLGPVPPPPPPRRKRNEVKPHIVDIAVETFQLDTQTVSKPKPLTASMRRRNPPRIESYEDEEMMVPTPVKPYTLEATPAYARRRRNESESSMAASAPKSALQLEREALWKQFEAEQIRSPDITPTSARRASRIICQEKSITTAPITTFTTATVPTTQITTTTISTEKSDKSEKAKKPKRKWWSCFGGGGVESDQEVVVVNEKP